MMITPSGRRWAFIIATVFLSASLTAACGSAQTEVVASPTQLEAACRPGMKITAVRIQKGNPLIAFLDSGE